MTHVRCSNDPARRPGLVLMLLGLIAALPAIGLAQDSPPPQPAEGAEGEEAGDAEAKPEVDPRVGAAVERARQLRINRQTEVTSSLPTESEFTSSLSVPDSLIGNRGIRSGRVVILPLFSVGAFYTDNAEAAPDGDESEELSLSAIGEVRVQSALARHQFGVDARATSSYSFQDDDEDIFDWVVGTDARLDLSRRSSVFGRVEYSFDTEDDSSADAGGAANDIEVIDADIGYQLRRDKIRYIADAGVLREDFSGDGSGDRDNTTFELNQTFQHQTARQLTLFASPQYAYTLFDQEVADDGEVRDAHTATLLVGADLALGAALTLSGAVGYSQLIFENSDQSNAGTVIASSTLEYRPSPLTAIELSGRRALEISTLDGADARTDTAVALGLTRQVGLDTSLSADVGATFADFDGIDRNDVDLTAGAGVSHRLTDNLFFTLAYQYERRLSNDDGVEFDENRAIAGLSVIY